jgi:hypothetical protein
MPHVPPPPPASTAALAAFAVRDGSARKAIHDAFILAADIGERGRRVGPPAPGVTSSSGKRAQAQEHARSLSPAARLKLVALGIRGQSPVQRRAGAHGASSPSAGTPARAVGFHHPHASFSHSETHAPRNGTLSLLGSWRLSLLCCAEDAPRDELEQIIVKASKYRPDWHLPDAKDDADGVRPADMAVEPPSSAHVVMTEEQAAGVLLPWLVGRGAAAADLPAAMSAVDEPTVAWRVSRMCEAARLVARLPANAASERLLRTLLRHESGLRRLFDIALEQSLKRGGGASESSPLSSPVSPPPTAATPPSSASLMKPRTDRVSLRGWQAALKLWDVFPALMPVAVMKDAYQYALNNPLLLFAFPSRLRIGAAPTAPDGADPFADEDADGAHAEGGEEVELASGFAGDERLSPSRLRAGSEVHCVVQPSGLCFIAFVESIVRAAMALPDSHVASALAAIREATGVARLAESEVTQAKLTFLLAWINTSNALPHPIFDVPKLQTQPGEGSSARHATLAGSARGGGTSRLHPFANAQQQRIRITVGTTPTKRSTTTNILANSPATLDSHITAQQSPAFAARQARPTTAAAPSPQKITRADRTASAAARTRGPLSSGLQQGLHVDARDELQHENSTVAASADQHSAHSSTQPSQGTQHQPQQQQQQQPQPHPSHLAASARLLQTWPGIAHRMRVIPPVKALNGRRSPRVRFATPDDLRDAVAAALNTCEQPDDHFGVVLAAVARMLSPQPWFLRHGVGEGASPPASPTASPDRLGGFDPRIVGMLALRANVGVPPPPPAPKLGVDSASKVKKSAPKVVERLAAAEQHGQSLLLDDPLANGRGAAGSPAQPRLCAVSGSVITLYGCYTVAVQLPEGLDRTALFKEVYSRLGLDVYACGPNDTAWRHLDAEMLRLRPPPQHRAGQHHHATDGAMTSIDATATTASGGGGGAADDDEDGAATADGAGGVNGGDAPPVTLVSLAFRTRLRLPVIAAADGVARRSTSASSGGADRDSGTAPVVDTGLLTSVRIRVSVFRRDVLEDVSSTKKNPRSVIALRTFKDPRPVPLRLRLFSSPEALAAFERNPDVGPSSGNAAVALASLPSVDLRAAARYVVWEPVLERADPAMQSASSSGVMPSMPPSSGRS